MRTKRFFKIAASLLLAFCLQFIHSGNAEEDIEIEGKILVERLCARCHAIGLTGDSPFEPAAPFRDLVTKWPVDSLAEAFAEGIIVGHPAMPEFQFEPQQIEQLLAYLKTLQTE